ncbi:MAG: S8 family serine peptidase [Bacteroidales bacterium]|nr:S8 family serine peptidase [Bacteroidales bacterium]
MKIKTLLLSAILLSASLTAFAQHLGPRPLMPVADAKEAQLHFQGLSSNSAFLLADLLAGNLSEDQLVEKYALVHSAGQLAVPAIATLQGGEDALAPYGVALTALNGKSASLLIPLRSFVRFAQSGLCSWLDVGSKCRPALSNARSAMGIDAIHSGQYLPQAYDGTGVVVGIIDIGFEYGHPSFYAADGTTYRVKRVWEQSASTGTAPLPYNYGRELTTQSAILAAQYSHNNESHGTHVAGIAAGCGGNTTQTAAYRGIAPGADIVLVATTMTNAGVLDGINYIRAYAASQQKPCVINMSIGSHVGPHDGTSAFDRACDDLFLARPDSLLLVGSAGNEGIDNLHISHLFPGTDSTLFTFLQFSDPSDGNAIVDIWGEPNVPFRAGFAIVNMSTGSFVSSGNFFLSNTSYYDTESQSGNQLQIQVYSSGTNAFNQRQNITFVVDYSLAASNAYGLCLVVACDTVATVHAWGSSVEFADGGFSSVQAGNTDYTVGEVGGTGRHMISVGAYTSRTQWTALSGTTYTANGAIEGNLASFSSHGPLLDGRTKPDITAPGQYIAAPFNRFNTAMTNSSYAVASTSFGGQTEYYGVMQGTSMASPMVAGVMALWLQHNPALGPDSALAILRRTATADGATGTIPATGSNLWGWGKVNALGALPSSGVVTYTLTVASSNSALGTVSGGGTFAEGTSTVITATPAAGCHFVSWNDGNTDNPRTVVVNANLNFMAIFEQDAFVECDPVSSFPWAPAFDEALSCWRNVDADGDGYLWTTYGDWAVSESFAYLDHANVALDPDNWLISRPLVLPQNASLSWTAKALADEYYSEHYSVFISTTGNEPANFTTRLFQETLPNANAQSHSVSLASYAGQTVRIAFRHHQSADVFILGLRDVKVGQQAVGIADADLADATVAADGRRILVDAPEGTPLLIVDILGRTLVDQSALAGPQTFDMPAPGVYMVSLGGTPARKIVLF